MARRIAAIALAAATIVSGCATAPNEIAAPQTGSSAAQAAADAIDAGPQPDWVAGASADYPRLHYLTSRTGGDSAEQARQRALANLTDYFLIDTEAVGMTLQQATDAAGYELKRSHMGPSAQTVAAPEVERVLEKIEVVEQWFDNDANTYHALAAVPRNTAKGYLQDQIQALDEQTREYMKQARSDPDPFVQAGTIAMAWRAQQIRAQLQQSMQHADLTGRGIKPEFNLALIKQDAENLLTTLQIQPAGLEGEPNAERVAQLIRGGLLTQDLNPAAENADYMLRGSLETAVIGERNGWAVGHGTLKLVLTDKVTGRVLGSTEWQVEVPGLDEGAAIRRVYEKTEYMLKVKMRDVLMEMAMQ